MSTVGICQAWSNLDVDHVFVVGPATRIRHFIKQHRTPRVSNHPVASDVVAVLVNHAARHLAQLLVDGDLILDVLESGQRAEQCCVVLHEALAAHHGAGSRARDGQGLGRGGHVGCVCLRAACTWQHVESWFAAIAFLKCWWCARASLDFSRRLRFLGFVTRPGQS